MCFYTYGQFMVESLQPYDQTMISWDQLVLQLRYVRVVRRLSQVVGQDVHKDVKQDQTGEGMTGQSKNVYYVE